MVLCVGFLYLVRKDINTLRLRQNGRHFADDIFKWIFLNENAWISINISLKFVLRGPINNIPSFVHIMAWRQPGDKPLSEQMMVKSLTHICVTQPQCVNTLRLRQNSFHFADDIFATDNFFAKSAHHSSLWSCSQETFFIWNQFKFTSMQVVGTYDVWWSVTQGRALTLPLCRRVPGVASLLWCHNERDGISNDQCLNYLLNCLFRCRSKETSKLRITGLCKGNSPVTSEFPAQRASNAEHIFIWWHHHDPVNPASM